MDFELDRPLTSDDLHHMMASRQSRLGSVGEQSLRAQRMERLMESLRSLSPQDFEKVIAACESLLECTLRDAEKRRKSEEQKSAQMGQLHSLTSASR